MTDSTERKLAAVAGVCAVCGVWGWVLYWAIFHREPGEDWLVFHTAARAILDGDHALVWDGVRFTAVLNERYADWLAWPLTLHPWVYPPSFLLLLLPFGLVPADAGMALFLLATYAAAVLAAWRLAADRRQRCLYLATLALCPAVASTVFSGQNAFLTSALFLGAFALIERRPMLGGALLGLLSIKPQFCLLIPVALLAARDWRALVGAAVGGGGLGLAALVVLGPGDWQTWVGLMTGSGEQYARWVAAGRLNGISLFADATLLGAPSGLANLAQAAAIALGAAGVFWVFRTTARRELRLAAMLAGVLLAAPHASQQDGVLLGLAAAAFLAVALEDGLRVRDAAAVTALWITPLLNPPSLFRIGLVTPVILVAFLACVALKARQRAAAYVPADGAQANETRTGTRIGQADRSIA